MIPHATGRAPRLVGSIVCAVALAAGCGSAPATTPTMVPLVQVPAVATAPPVEPTPTPPATVTTVQGAVSPRLVVSLSRLRLAPPTTRGVAFATSKGILLAGGLTASGTTGAVSRISLPSGQVVALGRLARPVHDAAGVTLGGSMLVFGGGVTTQDAWVQRVAGHGSGSITGRLPVRRADLSAVIVGSEAIVVGGGAGGRADPRVLATTDGRHFRVVARLPVAVRYAAVTAVAGLVFVIGGATSAGDAGTIQVVDVAAGTARVVGRLPVPTSHATALTIGGSIVVAGGRHAGRALDSVIAIDPTTYAVRLAGQLPRAASDAAGVVVGGVGYLLGGESAHPLATVVTITGL